MSAPDMLTARDVADILRISYHEALVFIKHSGIDYIKIGNRYRVSKDKLIAFISAKGKKFVSS
jgi:hypothetical protein